MQVEIVWGTGEGRTRTDALDSALTGAGIQDYNLVEYSSMLPSEAAIEFTGTLEREFAAGAPVGVVLETAHSATPGETVVAGLGVAHADEGGLLMEEHGSDPDMVREDLVAVLENGRDRRPEWNWTESRTKLVSHTVQERGTAVIAAVFRPLEYR